MAKGKTIQRRGDSWTEEETECLLSIWNEQSIEEQLEDAKVNETGIYGTLCNEMAKNGYIRSAHQCKVRMHTLKRNYRQCKGTLNKSEKAEKPATFITSLMPLWVVDLHLS